MRDLRHDNINPFIGACTDSGNIMIVTQYGVRGSLQVRCLFYFLKCIFVFINRWLDVILVFIFSVSYFLITIIMILPLLFSEKLLLPILFHNLLKAIRRGWY